MKVLRLYFMPVFILAFFTSGELFARPRSQAEINGAKYWAKKKDEVNDKLNASYAEKAKAYQASLDAARAEVATRATQGLTAEQLKNLSPEAKAKLQADIVKMQADLKKQALAGGTIGPAASNVYGRANKYSEDLRGALSLKSSSPKFGQGMTPREMFDMANKQGLSIDQFKEKYYGIPQPAVKPPTLGQGMTPREMFDMANKQGLSVDQFKEKYYGIPQPAVKPPTLGQGMTPREMFDMANAQGLSMDQFKEKYYGVPKPSLLTIIGTGITDGKLEVDRYGYAICPPGSKNCTYRGGVGTYQDNSKQIGNFFDALTDVTAMKFYQKFLDQATIDPFTGEITLPEEVFVNGIGGIERGHYSLDDSFFIDTDPQGRSGRSGITTYMSVRDLMEAFVKQACGGTNCNGQGQDVSLVAYSAGGVSTTLGAIALDNAGFDVQGMTGFEAVIPKSSEEIMRAIVETSNNRINTGNDYITNYGALGVKDNGDPIVSAMAIINQIGSGQGFNSNYYDGYVPTTNPGDPTTATGLHRGEYENGISVIANSAVPGGPQPTNGAALPAPNIVVPQTSCPQGTVHIFGSCVHTPNLTIRTGQAPNYPEYVPQATSTPVPPSTPVAIPAPTPNP